MIIAAARGGQLLVQAQLGLNVLIAALEKCPKHRDSLVTRAVNVPQLRLFPRP
jgi:hypothetical protein